MSISPTPPGARPTGGPAPGPATSPEIDALRAEIAARLRPVCSSMPDAEFDALVREIAAFKLRWSEGSSEG